MRRRQVSAERRKRRDRMHSGEVNLVIFQRTKNGSELFLGGRTNMFLPVGNLFLPFDHRIDFVCHVDDKGPGRSLAHLDPA